MVNFLLREGDRLTEAGFEVAWEQFTLRDD